MKVSFLINSLTAGGAERVASILVRELSKSDQVFFYTLERDRFYRLSSRISDTSLSQNSASSPALKRIAFLLLLATKYAQEVKKKDPDVLVSFLELSNFVNIIVGRLLKKPTIIGSHNHASSRFSSKTLYGKVHRFLIKRLYRLADRVVCVSKAAALDLEKNFSIPRTKLRVIYNLHDIESYIRLSQEPLEEKFSSFFEGSLVFVSVGRFTSAKGFWHLLRSFSKVSHEIREAKLLILGDGPDRPLLESLARKLKIDDRVLMPGRQSNPFCFLKRSSCFVMSSIYEGLPNVLIEALAVGLPIISTDCLSGPREILAPEVSVDEDLHYPFFGSWGILTQPFSGERVFDDRPLSKPEELLSDLMVRAVTDSGLRERYSKGQKRALDFCTEKKVREWRSLLLETV